MNYKSLIANRIVSKGIVAGDDSFNLITIDDIEALFDENTAKYITENFEQIIEVMKEDERVAEIEFDKDNFEIGISYYWSYCLNDNGRAVLDIAEEEKIEVEHEDVNKIASELMEHDRKYRVPFIIEQLKGIEVEYER